VTDTVESQRDAARVRPRIRTAAIVWGLVVAALAALLGWFVLDPARVTAVGLSLASAEPGTLAIGGVALVLAAGVVIVIGSVLSVVHRAQDRARTRREQRAATSAVPTAISPD